MDQLIAHRELKHRGVRATDKAVLMDALQTATRIGDVVSCVLLSFILALRGSFSSLTFMNGPAPAG
jgi:hypothetical protein